MTTKFLISTNKVPFGENGRLPAESATTPEGYVNLDDFQQKINSITDFVSGVIESPEDKDYVLIRNSAFEMTITSVTAMATAGTGTATIKVDGVALGGAANSVSTTESVQGHASANVLPVGGDLVLTVSALSELENMDFTVKYTRGVS